MKPNPLKLVRDDPAEVGAMPDGPRPRAAHRANLRCLDHPASVAIAGPSEAFIKRTRNPDLERPTKFIPTVKGPDDVVI